MQMATQIKAVISTAITLFIAGCGGHGSSGNSVDGTPVVQTGEGPVRGITHSGYDSFFGIPYAAPPVGPLRWKPPVPAAKRTNVLDASEFGAVCTQGSALAVQGSENCLFLNVYRPSVVSGSGKQAPVMVWVHGGGYSSGAGSVYDLAPLVQSQGVVGVSINYRLGAFGFMAHPALSSGESDKRSGNYGIEDMQAALKWVHDNIASFGGDANNVTVFGESAGGNAVYTLLASPASKGLFQKAIAQSGGYYRNQPTQAVAEQAGLNVDINMFGCSSSASQPAANQTVAACLRNLSPAQVLAAKITEPVIDGTVLAETTASAFASGRFNQMPLLAGSTHNEGTYFTFLITTPITATNYMSLGTLNMPSANLQALYPLPSYPTPAQALADAVGDYHMFCGAMQDADNISAYVKNVYFYDWDDPDPPSAPFAPGYPGAAPGIQMLAAHALDVTYWLGLILPSDRTAARDELQTAMMKYLGQFAKTGDPNSTTTPSWIQYNSNTRTVMHLGFPRNDQYDAYDAHKCSFWYAASPSESLN